MYIPGGNSKFEIRVTGVSVLPPDEPLFSERCTRIVIEDEAAGEFLRIRQHTGNTDSEESIAIEPSEWPVLRDAIEFMFCNLRDENEPTQRRSEPAELPAEADHAPVAVPVMPF